MDQALGAFQHAMEHPLRCRHLPEHVHVDAAAAAGHLMGDARLLDAAADGIDHQFLMALAAGAAMVFLGDQLAIGVIGIGVHAGEGADAAGVGPGARALAVGDGNALAAFDQRQDFLSGNDDGVKSFHARLF